MRALQREGVLDPCLRVRYQDDLFNAALVSFGTAGVIYSGEYSLKALAKKAYEEGFRFRKTRNKVRLLTGPDQAG